MQLPIVIQPTMMTVPPLHGWPRPMKYTLLALAVLGVILAYLLLGSGLIALVAVFIETLQS